MSDAPAADHDQAEQRSRATTRFEAARPTLRALAFRMLGNASDAEDVVQDAWLRLASADVDSIENLEGWLTTVVARASLDLLRSRTVRSEHPLDAITATPAPARAVRSDPEEEAQLADAVGLALLVVLDRLAPAERVAFVLHDAFDLPFEDIAAILRRSPAATRQLASRARRRVRGTAAREAAGLRDAERARAHQQQKRAVVEEYLAASRAGDLDALLAVLHPDVVLRVDAAALRPGEPAEVRGAPAVAGRALAYGRRAPFSRAALVDGAVGVLVAPRGRLVAALRLTIEEARVVAIDLVLAPARLERLTIAVLDD